MPQQVRIPEAWRRKHGQYGCAAGRQGKIISQDSTNAQPLKVLQITDTHLFDSADGCLLGLNTEQSLQAVLDDVKKRHLPADLVLATGDLAHIPTPAAYERVASRFGELGIPVYCLPGNHDEGEMLHAASNGGPCHLQATLTQGNWQFVFLDSTIPGSEGAHFPPERLQALDTALSESDVPNSLVCLHHHPVNMDSRWLDTMAVDNQDEFFSIIDRHPAVRGILWGHVHQQFDGNRHDIQLMGTPSTCIQFKPGSHDFALDATPPGYRWLLLQADGRIDTGVERLAGIPGTLDMSGSGY